MERLTVRLDPKQKRWLSCRSRQEGVSMAELIRRGVRKLREEAMTAAPKPPFVELLEATARTWPGGDGLELQRQLRDEWRK